MLGVGPKPRTLPSQLRALITGLHRQFLLTVTLPLAPANLAFSAAEWRSGGSPQAG